MNSDANRLTRAREALHKAQRSMDAELAFIEQRETSYGEASQDQWRRLWLATVAHTRALRELFDATMGTPAPEPSRSHATYTIDHSCYRAIKTYVATTDTRAFEALERLYSFKGGGDESDVKALIEVCDTVGLTRRADFLRNLLEGE